MGETLQPVRGKPFSHLATGVVLRAFAAHPVAAPPPGGAPGRELLAGRFFQRDAYPDRQAVSYWTAFRFPFWFTNLLSSLDALTQIGFTAEHPAIRSGLDWFIEQQNEDGGWSLKILQLARAGRAPNGWGWRFAGCLPGCEVGSSAV